MADNNELEKILKEANKAVQNAKITDKDLKVEAFKFSMNYLYAAKHGHKK